MSRRPGDGVGSVSSHHSLAPAVRHLLHRYIPAHFNDPLGLAVRLIRTRHPAALFAMGAAAAGAATAPLDLLLKPLERRTVGDASTPRHPLILVCGAPRSGTTLVYQTLINHLPVAYFSNLTSLFPRSPLTSLRLFQRFLAAPAARYDSFYGRTPGLAGSNDALYLWDRWLGPDRARPPESLLDEAIADMQQFFAACDGLFNRPLVNKNNNLNVSAHLVAAALPHAHFVCVTREPGQLARSLYRARLDIHGTDATPYGLAAGVPTDGSDTDPVRSVCEQAMFFQRVAKMQQARIGADRFSIVRYEEFCRRPRELVEHVAADVLNDRRAVHGEAPAAFTASKSDKVDGAVARRIDEQLVQLE